jgi:hypothetical protein
MKFKAADFAEKCQLARTSVYKLAKEEKIILIKGYIDTDLPTNKAFIERRQLHLKEQERENTENTPQEISLNSLTELKRQNYFLDIEYKRLRNDQKKGNLIPFVESMQINSTFIKAFQMSFLQQTEALIRDLSNEAGLSNLIITKACSRLRNISNDSSATALKEIKKAIDILIEQQTT